MGREISYRPLIEADLPLMTDWLNRVHLRAYFQREPISAAEVATKYGPRIRGEAPAHCSLALLDDRPFGFLQCYRVVDWPDWAEAISAEHGLSVDLCIGEPELIGQGLGRRMLAGYVEQVAFARYPQERLCWIVHVLENTAARNCSAAAGFSPVRTFIDEGRPSILMVRQASPLTPPSA